MPGRKSKQEVVKPEAAAAMDKFILRMPAGMRDDIKASAARGNRSMNAEIVRRLHDWAYAKGEVAALNKQVDRDASEIERLNLDVQVLRESLQREYDSRKLLDSKRLPEGLARRIQQVAVQRKRSFEEQVIQALEKAFPPPDTFSFIAEMTTLLAPLDDFVDPNPDSESNRAVVNMRILLKYLTEEYAEGREEGAFDRFYQEFEVGPNGIRRRAGGENVSS